VIILDAPRPLGLLQQVCRALGEPMIAVLEASGDDIALLCVTPEGTHPGAGHATHAAAWVALNRVRPGAAAIELSLGGGARRSVRAEGDLVAVDWPVMPHAGVDQIVALAKCLGREPRETLDSSFGAIAIFASEEDVAALEPDLAEMERLQSDVIIATAPAHAADFAIRVFAPKLGLPEDPVCGTAHRILVPLWSRRLGRRTLVSHQLSPRGGQLFCQLDGDAVTIAGHATLFLEGELTLPQ
jgi:predicted PhzF superfamily epimerase YddE/YHI9